MISCLIPARGGSKSIPLKNIVTVNGKPLIWWVLNAANNSNIDEIYVSTDSEGIKGVVNSFKFDKVKVVSRSPENSTDTASTESVMEEFASQYDFDDLVLIQPTSPLLSTEDINEAIRTYKEGKFDSLLTIVRQHNFQWKTYEDGECIPTNYSYINRPRRQDHDGYCVENGAFYITSKESFDKSKCRISGRIGYYEMPKYTSYEIDEESDILIIENLLKQYA
jgi:N-acylneuraminate cytidylyltransferase